LTEYFSVYVIMVKKAVLIVSISKEQFEQTFKDKPYFELEDLVHLIEDNFGYNVTLKKKATTELTDEQKKNMTAVIFKDESVLHQLRQTQKDVEAGISTYSDSEEEFARLLDEVGNEK
jgi:hypothetical protein